MRRVAAVALAGLLLAGCSSSTSPADVRRDKVKAMVDAANSGLSPQLVRAADDLLGTLSMQLAAGSLTQAECAALHTYAVRVRSDAGLLTPTVPPSTAPATTAPTTTAPATAAPLPPPPTMTTPPAPAPVAPTGKPTTPPAPTTPSPEPTKDRGKGGGKKGDGSSSPSSDSQPGPVPESTLPHR